MSEKPKPTSITFHPSAFVHQPSGKRLAADLDAIERPAPRGPRKPSETFGAIVFGKDGSVRPAMERLSHQKDEQERSVGERFADKLRLVGINSNFVRQLREDDHDFLISAGDREVIVQAAEVHPRRYLVELSKDQYVSGDHTFTDFVLGHETYFGVDATARKEAITSVVIGKLEKHYSKPRQPLWLLVWTTGNITGQHYEASTLKIDEAVVHARGFLAEHSPTPFDEIWFFNVVVAPMRVWPVSAT